ncbi:MAG: hypothetical protein WC877_00505 [Dehalococcoidales bacterium]|jgi:hypothetical protein
MNLKEFRELTHDLDDEMDILIIYPENNGETLTDSDSSSFLIGRNFVTIGVRNS